MRGIKKIISSLIFIIGALSVANIVYPQIGQKVKQALSSPALREGTKKLSLESQKIISGLLRKDGEIEGGGQVAGQSDILITQSSKEEIVAEVKEKVTQIITEKVVEVRELPEKQMEAIKKDVRKQIYQEVCEQWLKEE